MLIPELDDLEVTIDDAIEWLEEMNADYSSSEFYWENQYFLEKEDGYEDAIEECIDSAAYFAERVMMTRMAITALKTIKLYSPSDNSQNLIDYVEKRLEYAKNGVEDPSRVDELEKLINWMLSEKEGNNNE